MAYINVDEFKRKLIDEKNFFPAIVARALDEMPTADVVPRAEVEKIFEAIDKRIASLEYGANTPRKTVKVEELKAQCDWILHEVIPKTLAELKKEYIGDKQRKEDEGK